MELAEADWGNGVQVKHTLALIATALCLATGSASAEPERVGIATLIKTAVNGDYGTLEVREPVHRNERIRTSKSGLGEFIFKDGTKLAVGWGSSVVIDKFVFDGDNSARKLAIKAAKGTFRWVSGKSKSSAYEIVTPAGTIGVRGTAFDFYVGADGTTAVVLLKGRVDFCNGGGCVELKRRCDCVIAKRGSSPNLSRANRQTLISLGNVAALPFLSGNQSLSGGFGASSGCGMAVAKVLDTPNPRPKAAKQQAKAKAASAKPEPEKPTKPSKPEKPTPAKPEKPTPTKPSKPEKPDSPSKPEKPDSPWKPETPGKPETHKSGTSSDGGKSPNN